MTDKEIIKALECCASYGLLECNKCPKRNTNNTCMYALNKDALDLINRQKAEIERLKQTFKRRVGKEIEETYNCLLEEIKTEAIKEFAERLKNRCDFSHYYILFRDIDEVVKEMVESE